MSHYLTRAIKGDPQGYHDIDTDLDSSMLEHLPLGLMQHHAFQPHLWRAEDAVSVTSTDGRRYDGRAIDVSMATGNVLIQLENMPPKPSTRQHVA